jgi:hypothetical protein
MAPARKGKSPMQIDGQILRRSPRLSKIAQHEVMTDMTDMTDIKDTKDTKDMHSTVNPAEPICSAPTVVKPCQKKTSCKQKLTGTKMALTNVLLEFDSMKISDVFKYVKSHSVSESDSSIIISVLQRVIKNTKKLGIRNRIKDVFDRRHDVIAFVCSSFHLSFETVDDILDTIMCYKEVKDAQLRSTAYGESNDLDMLISSLATIKI